MHLGGVLNLLTGGRLNVYGVQNLSLIVSVLGGATTSYIAVRLLAPGWRAAAVFLAALYVLCPAIMVILACMDMYATTMTLPWMPLFWLGIAAGLRSGNDPRPLMVSTGALGIIWYAHPAVAVWLMLFWLLALLIHAFFWD